MSDDPQPSADDLIFSKGFIWERGYVKRAASKGRMLYFHISVPLIVQCLANRDALSDPVRILTANDTLIQEACRRAFAKSIHLQETDFDLCDDDFSPEASPGKTIQDTSTAALAS